MTVVLVPFNLLFRKFSIALAHHQFQDHFLPLEWTDIHQLLRQEQLQ
jgi:hypothetical protein